MADLITLSDAKTYIPEATSADDARLSQLITLVSADIESACHRSFSNGVAKTDYLDGGVENLLLDAPIQSISKVTDTLTATVIDSTLYDFDPDRGFLYLIPQSSTPSVGLSEFIESLKWDSGRRRWKCEYTKGYAAVPGDIILAALMWVKVRFDNPGAIESEKIGDYSHSGGSKVPPEIMDKLSRYIEAAF